MSTTVVNAPTTAANLTVDVAGDRPAHWNKLRPATARLAQQRSGRDVSTGRGLKTTLVSKVNKIARLKPLPVAPVVVSAVNIEAIPTTVSFKPSWMTTSSSYHSSGVSATAPAPAILRSGEVNSGSAVPASLSSPTATGHISCIATEDIQDADTFSPGSPPLLPSHQSAGLQLTSLEKDVQFVSPDRVNGPGSLTFDTADSAERRQPARSGTSRSGAKPRPGSFKAKLQKISRDCDAAENRIANVPIDRASRAVDLQDPRHRATCYVDLDVVEVLPNQAPFASARMEVVGSWRKSMAPTEYCDYVDGDVLVGLFKPDTCVGLGRTLVAGMRVRVYDCMMLLNRESGQGVGNRSMERFRGARLLDQATLICTTCWEPVEGV